MKQKPDLILSLGVYLSYWYSGTTQDFNEAAKNSSDFQTQIHGQ